VGARPRLEDLASDGDPRVVGIVEDISLERQALEHVEKARQLAEEASTAKTLFLANLSHGTVRYTHLLQGILVDSLACAEIRTPLQGILGMLELLDSTSMSPAQRDNLHIAKRSADHMLSLVNDLLDVVRIEQGKLEICPARFSLHDYLDYLSSSFARNAEARGNNYTCRLSPDLPAVVVGDKDRMAQVLNNVVGNALKFTPPGGHVTLTVSRPSREMVRERLPPAALECGDAHMLCVLLEVSDTGIGIPTDKLPHIFDAFYQVDPAHTKKYAGLGMGLKICSELVRSVSLIPLLLCHIFGEDLLTIPGRTHTTAHAHLHSMMNGRIWVDSTPGQGTTFHVLLPFAQPTREQEEERERDRAEADGPGDVGNKSLGTPHPFPFTEQAVSI
jgi:signal transduction histidine kinase